MTEFIVDAIIFTWLFILTIKSLSDRQDLDSFHTFVCKILSKKKEEEE